MCQWGTPPGKSRGLCSGATDWFWAACRNVSGGVFVEREWQLVTGGDAAAFDQYVTERQAGLVRYVTLLAGSRALGEDLVQDVLIRLYPRWAQLADPHPYVRRCVTNEFLSWRRSWSTRFVQVVPDQFLKQQPVDPGRTGTTLSCGRACSARRASNELLSCCATTRVSTTARSPVSLAASRQPCAGTSAAVLPPCERPWPAPASTEEVTNDDCGRRRRAPAQVAVRARGADAPNVVGTRVAVPDRAHQASDGAVRRAGAGRRRGSRGRGRAPTAHQARRRVWSAATRPARDDPNDATEADPNEPGANEPGANESDANEPDANKAHANKADANKAHARADDADAFADTAAVADTIRFADSPVADTAAADDRTDAFGDTERTAAFGDTNAHAGAEPHDTEGFSVSRTLAEPDAQCAGANIQTRPAHIDPGSGATVGFVGIVSTVVSNCLRRRATERGRNA